MPAQGLRTDVQVLRDRFEVRPGRAVTAQQAAQLAAQAVAFIRPQQQVGGGALEKMLEGAFVLQQRQAQVAAGKYQAAVWRAEYLRAGKEQVVFAGMGRHRVTERCLLQADTLADQPTAQAMPDHQQAFTEEVIKVPQLRIVQAEPGHVAFSRQLPARTLWE